MTRSQEKPVSQWRSILAQPETLPLLGELYGTDAGVLHMRTALIQQTLQAFQERFGDVPARVFRAPGRINLRGMHVDTHGGFLNLMTHHRETILVAAPTNGTTNSLANVNPDFADVSFDLEQERQDIEPGCDWWNVIANPAVAARANKRNASSETAWSNYCIGAALRIAHAHPHTPFRGLNIMVNSDLPRGAALSSSAALSVASLLAYSDCNAMALTPEQTIAFEQDVEWYAGARVGMSDQTAILLGQAGRILHIAVFSKDFRLDGARYVPFPEALDLLVVHSHTKRRLSGAQRLQYTLNRFAYSMALTVLQAELMRSGWTSAEAQHMDRLSRITPETLGGIEAVYDILRRIPLHIDLETLRKQYAPTGLDEEYARYFGDMPTSDQPKQIPLRGPLMFGIAESERARLFPEALASGDYARAGAFMTAGHNGDRVQNADGTPYSADISDAALEALAGNKAPLPLQPGAYGASSPALDALVDAALDAGALGACLTGAGIAGAVLALCRHADATAVRRAWRRLLQSDAYAERAHLPAPLDAETAAQAITANHSVGGASALCLP